MSGQRECWVLCLLLAQPACAPVFGLDPTLRARVAQKVLRPAGDGSIRLDDWLLLGSTPPHVVPSGDTGRGEVRSALTLRAPAGEVVKGECQYKGHHFNLITSADSYLECVFQAQAPDAQKETLHLSGYAAGPDILSARRVTGGKDLALGREMPPPAEPGPAPRYTIELDGSPRQLNIYRSGTIVERAEVSHTVRTDVMSSTGPKYQSFSSMRWRESCCQRLEPLGAIVLDPAPALYLAPGPVEPDLHRWLIFAAAMILSARDTTALPDVFE